MPEDEAKKERKDEENEEVDIQYVKVPPIKLFFKDEPLMKGKTKYGRKIGCVRCGRRRGIVRRYGLHLCRQCFREIAYDPPALLWMASHCREGIPAIEENEARDLSPHPGRSPEGRAKLLLSKKQPDPGRTSPPPPEIA